MKLVRSVWKQDWQKSSVPMIICARDHFSSSCNTCRSDKNRCSTITYDRRRMMKKKRRISPQDAYHHDQKTEQSDDQSPFSVCSLLLSHSLFAYHHVDNQCECSEYNDLFHPQICPRFSLYYFFSLRISFSIDRSYIVTISSKKKHTDRPNIE